MSKHVHVTENIYATLSLMKVFDVGDKSEKVPTAEFKKKNPFAK
jgi:hypothetical protein